jgi:hypothetical protein
MDKDCTFWDLRLASLLGFGSKAAIQIGITNATPTFW